MLNLIYFYKYLLKNTYLQVSYDGNFDDSEVNPILSFFFLHCDIGYYFVKELDIGEKKKVKETV